MSSAVDDRLAAAAAGATAGSAPAVTDRYRMVDPYSEEGMQARRTAQMPLRIVLSVIVVALIALAGYFAWDALRPVDFAAYADEPITVVGLADEEFTIDAQELSELPCISQSFEGQGQRVAGEENIKTANAYGPLLSDFLALYGADPSAFRRVVITCKDGYTVVITPDMMDQEIVMSIAQGKDPLDEWQQPMRLVIPSEASGNWAYGVQTISFDRASTQVGADG